MPRKPKACIYCSQGFGGTSDHVPPRGFYPSNPPANLITVPCCEKCRVRDSEHDEFIRNLFISFDVTEPHQSIESELSDTRRRSFENAPSKANRLLEITGEVPDGRKAFTLDIPEVDRFLERVCRAVLFDAFRQPYFEASFNWTKESPFLPVEEQQIQNAFKIAPPECKRKQIADFFSYVAVPADDTNIRFVVLSFYNGLFVMGRFTLLPGRPKIELCSPRKRSRR